MAESTDPRTLLAELVAERRVQLTVLSRELGLNQAYLSQYLQRGKPRFLSHAVREGLGRYFGIDPDRFRSPEDPSLLAGPDPNLIEPATKFAWRLIGDSEDPEDSWVRAQVTAAAYALLLRGQPIRLDDEGTVAVLKLLYQRLRAGRTNASSHRPAESPSMNEAPNAERPPRTRRKTAT